MNPFCTNDFWYNGLCHKMCQMQKKGTVLMLYEMQDAYLCFKCRLCSFQSLLLYTSSYQNVCEIIFL